MLYLLYAGSVHASNIVQEGWDFLPYSLLLLLRLEHSFYAWSLRMMLILNRGILLWANMTSERYAESHSTWPVDGWDRDRSQRRCFNVHAQAASVLRVSSRSNEICIHPSIPLPLGIYSLALSTVTACAVRWVELYDPEKSWVKPPWWKEMPWSSCWIQWLIRPIRFLGGLVVAVKDTSMFGSLSTIFFWKEQAGFVCFVFPVQASSCIDTLAVWILEASLGTKPNLPWLPDCKINYLCGRWFPLPFFFFFLLLTLKNPRCRKHISEKVLDLLDCFLPVQFSCWSLGYIMVLFCAFFLSVQCYG